jgi:hypothetical protein
MYPPPPPLPPPTRLSTTSPARRPVQEGTEVAGEMTTGKTPRVRGRERLRNHPWRRPPMKKRIWTRCVHGDGPAISRLLNVRESLLICSMHAFCFGMPAFLTHVFSSSATDPRFRLQLTGRYHGASQALASPPVRTMRTRQPFAERQVLQESSVRREFENRQTMDPTVPRRKGLGEQLATTRGRDGSKACMMR